MTSEINAEDGQQNQMLKDLQTNIKETGLECMNAIRMTQGVIEKKLEKRMESRLSNLPGYHVETVSEKLGGKHNHITSLDENVELQDILKGKAEAQDVIRLFEVKTNKVDTEA